MQLVLQSRYFRFTSILSNTAVIVCRMTLSTCTVMCSALSVQRVNVRKQIKIFKYANKVALPETLFNVLNLNTTLFTFGTILGTHD